MFLIFFSDKQAFSPRCIDFTQELEASLSLFHLEFLAPYFPQTVALTASLLTFLLFSKAFAKPKYFLAYTVSPPVFFITLRLTNHLIASALSYCF